MDEIHHAIKTQLRRVASVAPGDGNEMRASRISRRNAIRRERNTMERPTKTIEKPLETESELTWDDVRRRIAIFITVLLSRTQACLRTVGEILHVLRAEHVGDAEVGNEELHQVRGARHLFGIVGARLEYTAGHRLGHRLDAHRVELGMVDHAEPDAEQERDQLLHGLGERRDDSAARDKRERAR